MIHGYGWVLFIASIVTIVRAAKYWAHKDDIECIRWLIITLILAQSYM